MFNLISQTISWIAVSVSALFGAHSTIITSPLLVAPSNVDVVELASSTPTPTRIVSAPRPSPTLTPQVINITAVPSPTPIPTPAPVDFLRRFLNNPTKSSFRELCAQSSGTPTLLYRSNPLHKQGAPDRTYWTITELMANSCSLTKSDYVLLDMHRAGVFKGIPGFMEEIGAYRLVLVVIKPVRWSTGRFDFVFPEKVARLASEWEGEFELESPDATLLTNIPLGTLNATLAEARARETISELIDEDRIGRNLTPDIRELAINAAISQWEENGRVSTDFKKFAHLGILNATVWLED